LKVHPTDPLDLKVFLDHKESWVLELRVLQVQRVHREFKDYRVHRMDLLDLKVYEDCKVS
jgi:hypothetical protein